MPAAISYLRRPGDRRFRAFKVDVLRIASGRIVEITTLGPAALLGPLGLPETLA
jgi:RNA polymerase sigma-70 factor (ECF subfamily)